MEKTQISLIEMKNKVVELLLKYDPEVKDHTTRSRMRFLAIMAHKVIRAAESQDTNSAGETERLYNEFMTAYRRIVNPDKSR